MFVGSRIEVGIENLVSKEPGKPNHFVKPGFGKIFGFGIPR